MTDVCFAGYIIPGYKPESLRRSEKQSEEAQALRPVRLPRTFCSCGKVLCHRSKMCAAVAQVAEPVPPQIAFLTGAGFQACILE